MGSVIKILGQLVTSEVRTQYYKKDIFARLITMSWLSRSSSATAGELRDNQDIVLKRKYVVFFIILGAGQRHKYRHTFFRE